MVTSAYLRPEESARSNQLGGRDSFQVLVWMLRSKPQEHVN
jgi:hypothetical protein